MQNLLILLIFFVNIATCWDCVCVYRQFVNVPFVHSDVNITNWGVGECGSSPPSFPGNYMMINEAVFYQSNATLAQNINQLFSPRHFTVILLSQKLFATCNQTFSHSHSEPDTSAEFYLQMICQIMFLQQ